jgi:hypothetical protein
VAKPYSFVGSPDDKSLLVKVKFKTWKELKKLAYLKDERVTDLVRQGIDRILEENQKILDKE